jgi:hypothetical protein
MLWVVGCGFRVTIEKQKVMLIFQGTYIILFH